MPSAPRVVRRRKQDWRGRRAGQWLQSETTREDFSEKSGFSDPLQASRRSSARVTKVIFRNAAVGRRFTESLRPSNLTRDVAHDVLSVPSGVQTGPYLYHDLACAPQAVSPGDIRFGKRADVRASFASKSGGSIELHEGARGLPHPEDARGRGILEADERLRQGANHGDDPRAIQNRARRERDPSRANATIESNTPRRARLHKACNVRDLNAQWENNTDKMIAKNQFKKRCARVPPTRLCTARPERLDPILSYPARARKTLTDDGRVSFRARNQVRGSEGARRGDSGRAPREAGVHALRGGARAAG